MIAVRLRQLVTAGSPGDGDYVDQVELEVHIIREGFRNGDKGVLETGRMQFRFM